IELDRSCSMQDKVSGTPKWTLAVNAIQKMTTDFKGKIRFGLAMFPDRITPSCDQGAIPIPVGPGKETMIQSLLNASLMTTDTNYPNGPCVTPIDAGMHQASTEPALMDKARQSYVLLITDGMQAGCNTYMGASGATMIISDLYTKQQVSTFVIG